VYRSEGQKAAHLLRSYLINKVPLLLASFAASPVYAFDAQFCISQALSRIDQNAFPTLSAMFEDTRSNNTFNDGVRQDFCFACCLHGLVPETSIETLLGEITYQTLPAGGRYVKEHLVQDCMADPEKIQSLIGELDYMDGNVGAVCQALTVVRNTHSSWGWHSMGARADGLLTMVSGPRPALRQQRDDVAQESVHATCPEPAVPRRSALV